jgi:hypothetical protein
MFQTLMQFRILIQISVNSQVTGGSHLVLGHANSYRCLVERRVVEVAEGTVVELT